MKLTKAQLRNNERVQKWMRGEETLDAIEIFELFTPSNPEVLGQFFTPFGMANWLVSMSPIPARCENGTTLKIIDPCAGIGSLIYPVIGGLGIHVTCWELEIEAFAILEKLLASFVPDYRDYTVRNCTAFEAVMDDPEKYDFVLMNPPFNNPAALGDVRGYRWPVLSSKSGPAFVEIAGRLLKPGGYLVMLAAYNIFDTMTKKARAWVDDVFPEIQDLDQAPGEFAFTGTHVHGWICRKKQESLYEGLHQVRPAVAHPAPAQVAQATFDPLPEGLLSARVDVPTVLRYALDVVAPFSTTKSSIEVVSNVRLVTGRKEGLDFLEFGATNFEAAAVIRTGMAIKVLTAGSVCVPAKSWDKLTRFDETQVKIDASLEEVPTPTPPPKGYKQPPPELKLTVKSGKSKSVFNATAVDVYPPLTYYDMDDTDFPYITVAYHNLHYALNAVLSCALSPNNDRSYIWIELDHDKLVLFATDGFALVRVKIPYTKTRPVSGHFRMCLPASAVKLILAGLDKVYRHEYSREVHIIDPREGALVVFSMFLANFQAQTGNLQIPDHKGIWKDHSNTKVNTTIETRDLCAVLKRVSVLDPLWFSLAFSDQNPSFKVHVETNELGISNDILPFSDFDATDSTPTPIAFHLKRFSRLTAQIPDEKFRFGLTSPTAPCVITAGFNLDCVYEALVMPMWLGEDDPQKPEETTDEENSQV